MSQDPPRRDTESHDRTLAGAPGESLRRDETFIGGLEHGAPDQGPPGPETVAHGPVDEAPVSVGAASATPVQAATSTLAPCPGCGHVPEHESRFCQTCGHEFLAGSNLQPRPQERSERTRPWLLIVGLVWAIIMVGALYFIYTNAFLIGSI